MTTRIWIDTDIGTDVDDAIVLRHPELVGVSTVFGDVELRARMVEALRPSAAPRVFRSWWGWASR